LIRCRTVLPDEAGIGLTPARLAKAASERSRPGWDQAASATAAVTGPMPGSLSSSRAGLCLTSSVSRVVFAFSSASRALTRFASRTVSCARGGGGEGFVAGAPCGDGRDLAAGEGSACVDPEVAHAQQGCQRVDRRGPLSAHVVAGGDQDPDRGADAVVGPTATHAGRSSPAAARVVS